MSERELRRNPLGELILFADEEELNETSHEEIFSTSERKNYHISSWNSISRSEQSRRTNARSTSYRSKWSTSHF